MRPLEITAATQIAKQLRDQLAESVMRKTLFWLERERDNCTTERLLAGTTTLSQCRHDKGAVRGAQSGHTGKCRQPLRTCGRRGQLNVACRICSNESCLCLSCVSCSL